MKCDARWKISYKINKMFLCVLLLCIDCAHGCSGVAEVATEMGAGQAHHNFLSKASLRHWTIY